MTDYMCAQKAMPGGPLARAGAPRGELGSWPVAWLSGAGGIWVWEHRLLDSSPDPGHSHRRNFLYSLSPLRDKHPPVGLSLPVDGIRHPEEDSQDLSGKEVLCACARVVVCLHVRVCVCLHVGLSGRLYVKMMEDLLRHQNVS